MTSHSRALLALAERLTPGLLRRGAFSVAVTGSAARGTATRGSDLDLWVLDAGPRRRRQRRVDGVNVTLLFDSPQTALEPAWLKLWEVEDLVVLRDDARHFEVIRAASTRQRPQLRRAVLNATRVDVLQWLRLARRGSSWQRVVALREAGFILAGVWLYLRRGWRVPRLELLRASLPARARVTFDALQGFPPALQLRASMPGVLRELQATATFLRAAGDEGWRETAPPKELRARLRAGAWTEAAHLARRHLLRVVFPRVFPFCVGEDVAALPSSLSAVTRSLHGLESTSAFDFAPVARAHVHLARLVRQLEVSAALGSSVRRALESSAR